MAKKIMVEHKVFGIGYILNRFFTAADDPALTVEFLDGRTRGVLLWEGIWLTPIEKMREYFLLAPDRAGQEAKEAAKKARKNSQTGQPEIEASAEVDEPAEEIAAD